MRARVRDLRLLWKLLLPSSALLVVLALVGAFVVIRFVSTNAHDNLDRDLFRRSLTAEAHVRDETLYLLESSRVAANLQGLPEAVASGDAAIVRARLASTFAARTDLDLLAVTTTDGITLASAHRHGDQVELRSGADWSGRPLVAQVIQRFGAGERVSRPGFFVDGHALLGVATPITTDGLVGVAVAAFDVAALAGDTAARTDASVDLYDENGVALASTGGAPPPLPASLAAPMRVIEGDVGHLFAPLEVLEQRLGSIAIGVPTEPTLGSVGSTAVRLSLLLVVAVLAVVALLVALSRVILRQVRPLVETNRALGRGDLGARAPVYGHDELGELAMGLNLMAEELQASRDELERRVAERTEELQNLADQLRTVSAGRAEYFAGVVHDLRTYLYAIDGYATLLRDPAFAADDAFRNEVGASIADALTGVSSLVDEILDLGRIDAGHIELDLDDVDVAAAVQSLRTTIDPLARSAGVTVDYDVPSTLPKVRADRLRLNQIVLNLASNAVKYTAAGGAIEIRARAADGHVALSVRDTGVGIPDDARAHLFEPFYRVPGSRTQGGQSSSGLGLALVKRLVDAHHGSLDVISAVGAGSTFTVTIPVAATTPPPRPSRPSRRRARVAVSA